MWIAFINLGEEVSYAQLTLAMNSGLAAIVANVIIIKSVTVRNISIVTFYIQSKQQ